MSNSKLGITKKVMLKPRQLSAALKLLDWTADDLARESRTSRHTIFAYISRGSNPKLTTVEAWIHALHKAGVVLFDEDEQHGLGVRLRKGVTFPVVPTPPPGAKAKARGRKGSS